MYIWVIEKWTSFYECNDPNRREAKDYLKDNNNIFYDFIGKHDLEEDWYEYLDKNILVMAKMWCDENNIPCTNK